MSNILIDMISEKDGITKVRFKTRDDSPEVRDQMDTLMKVIMGKFPKRAGYLDSTTIVLEANTSDS